MVTKSTKTQLKANVKTINNRIDRRHVHGISRKLAIAICTLWLYVHHAQAQATITEGDKTFTTYPYSDPDPVPRPGRVYPFFRFDGYTHKPVKKQWRIVTLSNPYITLEVTPGIGGKVWSAYEKSSQFPFIFSNNVVKFRDVGMRGAWTSGGMEFNFGDIGHAPTTSTAVDYYVTTNADGSVSCFVGATDWPSRTIWRVEINLRADKAYFTTRAWWRNATPLDQSYYNWTNTGVHVAGDLQYVMPGTHYIGHVGEFDTFPLDSVKRDISYYARSPFGSHKSYHVLGKPTDFYGGYWHAKNRGIGHYSPYNEKPGKKAWSWSLAREGMIWEDLLTDSDGQNVELQSGRLFNQASPNSRLTPFKHVAFKPYDTDTWNEFWFPVKDTRGMTHGSPDGALNLRVENGWLKLDWMALAAQSDTLKVFAQGKNLIVRKLSLQPLQVHRDSVQWQGSVDDVKVTVGNRFITQDIFGPLARPLTAPADFDWKSEYGLTLHGVGLLNQRKYAEADEVLRQALDKNANLSPALTALAQIRFRQGNYEATRELAKRALSVNAYDAEANFLWGLANEELNALPDALDGYAIAALSDQYKHAALIRLGYLSMAADNWHGAEERLDAVLETDAGNEEAANARLVVLRKLGEKDIALKAIDRMLALNPLNHHARFEKYLLTRTQNDRDAFTSMIRQELPFETYLEMAIHYNDRWKLADEALLLLELSPEHPIVHLWAGYIEGQLGRAEAQAHLTKAVAGKPDFIFPFRSETLRPLGWATGKSDSWKLKYYEALIRWNNHETAKARALFTACGLTPDYAPFYLAKAALFEASADIVKDQRNATVLECLERAYVLDPGNWRVASRLGSFVSDSGDPVRALAIARENFKRHPDSYMVHLQYAQELIKNKQYVKALSEMDKVVTLPAEMDFDAPVMFKDANIFYAIDLMKSKKWTTAIKHLKQAQTWPERMGAGEPYKPDNRITAFMMAYAYSQSGNKALARQQIDYIITYHDNDRQKLDAAGNEIAARLKAGERDFKAIASAAMEAESYPGKKYLDPFTKLWN